MSDKLIELVNAALKEEFHFVPLYKAINVSNKLLTNGVIVSPFIVGDSIYLVTIPGEIKPLTVTSVDIKMCKSKITYYIEAEGEIDGLDCLVPISLSQIGKTYFKTREAAEKALKERTSDETRD